MRLPFLLALAGLLLAPFAAHAEFLLQPNDFLAICGDSITKQKRYSVFVEDYILMCQPVSGLRVEQFGWSGEKYGGFLARAQNDILRFKPTVVTICYGMNDGLYKPSTPENVELFRNLCTKSVDLLKANGIRAGVLASPGAVDPVYRKGYKEYNTTLSDLRDVTHDVSAKEGFVFANLHDVMLATMTKLKEVHGQNYVFSGGDGIHPVPVGHLTMAYGLLKGLGCDGAIGTLTVDLASQKADGSPGQKIVSFQNGSLEVESTRYPFCFKSANAEFKDLTDVLPYLPFNQDLNRYLLVVKGLTGSGAKITWGTETKTFSKADLERGVNLAAEFLDNPFSEAFFKVDAAVRAQQEPETDEMIKVIHPLLKETDPAKIEQVSKSVDEADRARFQAAAALVAPVKHTLKIEPQP